MGELLRVSAAPCKSCPYRRDVPAGIWAAEEYAKLPGYDGEMADQVMKGGTALFLCHQRDGCLCAGWLACHGPDNLIALRLSNKLAPEVWNYSTSTPLFGSGAAAAAHGMAEIENPSPAARRMIERLLRKPRT